MIHRRIHNALTSNGVFSQEAPWPQIRLVLSLTALSQGKKQEMQQPQHLPIPFPTDHFFKNCDELLGLYYNRLKKESIWKEQEGWISA